ncbi:hypothetical Protein YC6258_05158 [Gynuella sunshinyii YC6258]|uniref:Uncharacterized protein n=1 Tax=Gynuella sunshinyii YC6258 TaxID=1445510 RepID=A0A0C5VV65_9GAMM|nr:hypothetical Protein YC6258_05158 [Gynuella sunshinyii YC6258]
MVRILMEQLFIYMETLTPESNSHRQSTRKSTRNCRKR